jgi:hypothetical protein
VIPTCKIAGENLLEGGAYFGSAKGGNPLVNFKRENPRLGRCLGGDNYFESCSFAVVTIRKDYH